ncbi:putative 26S protease regulatory subunit [Leishmania major strain Friedlin]|uniref:Putative 26S protease regulatory subunit n=1 Tax=Leishmania major TaxID=5664 RepID=E9ACJ9_LEIMA|nr:putative 26S protease regulatory subunit [Leishmania major strain Friedlin]CAG9567280.1 26S_protease_regulatory_subunit_-_putative [Leishmania major strain Friedlin]CBZ12016.1 putative 26S protease regulatory subunit [Leishmania major strain Friedlin]|eukprot:XP_003721730.1 putative 26S protease regulatory subunit [Leishmania major strain Friedlin]
MQSNAPFDPEREALRNEAIKKTVERNVTQARLKKVNDDVKLQQRELDKVEDQVNALLSIGHYVGEVLKRVDEERFIVKSISGARHLVGYRKSIKPEKLKFGARVALEITTFTIVKVLPREVDPQVYSMQYMSSDKDVSFQDIGGLQPQMRQMREVIELPLTNPELFVRVGIAPPKGVLLYGPPGTGKTLLAKAIAANVDAAFLKIVASSIVDKYIGESARVIREMFAYAREHEPCIIFIDEVDAIGSKRIEGSSSDREIQRTLMELLNQMDGFDKLGKVKVIMATNRPDTLDAALMRPGRLDRKIEIPLPNEAGRLDVLRIHSAKITKKGDIDFESVVKLSEGFNGADLRNVCTEAGMFAIRAGRDYVENSDFNKAVRKVADMKRLEGTAHQYSDQ